MLVDSAGKPFDLASLKGKVVLVSFVYTTCNGVCPLTTQALARVQKTLEEAKLWGKSVEFVSITLDPKRDTPEVLSDYAQALRRRPRRLALPDRLARTRSQRSSPPGTCGSRAIRPACSTTPRGSSCSIARGHQREIYNLEFLKPETVLEDVRGCSRSGHATECSICYCH